MEPSHSANDSYALADALIYKLLLKGLKGKSKSIPLAATRHAFHTPLHTIAPSKDFSKLLRQSMEFSNNCTLIPGISRPDHLSYSQCRPRCVILELHHSHTYYGLPPAQVSISLSREAPSTITSQSIITWWLKHNL